MSKNAGIFEPQICGFGAEPEPKDSREEDKWHAGSVFRFPRSFPAGISLFAVGNTGHSGARQSTSAKFGLARCRSRFREKAVELILFRRFRDGFGLYNGPAIMKWKKISNEPEKREKKNRGKKGTIMERKKETQLERNRKNWGSSFVGRGKLPSEISRRRKIY